MPEIVLLFSFNSQKNSVIKRSINFHFAYEKHAEKSQGYKLLYIYKKN